MIYRKLKYYRDESVRDLKLSLCAALGCGLAAAMRASVRNLEAFTDEPARKPRLERGEVAGAEFANDA